MAVKFRYTRNEFPSPYGDGFYLNFRQNDFWETSSRYPDGRLKLESHPHRRDRAWLIAWNAAENSSGLVNREPPLALFTPDVPSCVDRLSSESYARLRGRLYKGSASLGVTFASWRQSSDMIVNRYKQLSDLADRRFFLLKAKHRLLQRVTPREIASFHLEVIFGWKPLLQDIHAAATSIIELRPKTFWVKGQSKGRVTARIDSGMWLETFNTDVRVSRAARVEISNPNTWLRERAGLNNPAAVAWDLVPWSFVVNMFVNTGQLVNSLSDFAGLEFPDSSITTAIDQAYSQVLYAPGLSGSCSFRSSYKTQELGGVGRPPITFRVPELNMETVSMAASLFLQKFRRVDGLFS